MNKNKKSSHPPDTALVAPWALHGEKAKPFSNDLALESALGAPAGALGWLRAAFSEGARRRQPWLLDSLEGANPVGSGSGPCFGSNDAFDGALKEAVLWASRVFRRGVPTLMRGFLDDMAWRQSAGSPLLRLDLTGSVENLIRRIRQSGPAFLVVDEGVARHWSCIDQLFKEFPAEDGSSKFPYWIVHGGESAKNLETVAALCREFRSQCDPSVVIIAIGGGVTVDLAGFAAALCGVQHVNVPTTLLAMVDAAIGGKTGVNFPPWGKNQIGCFRFPAAVWLCPEFLQTLDRAELLAGGAECIKHAFIARDLDLADRWAETLAADFSPAFSTLIMQAIALKDRVVQGDPFELELAGLAGSSTLPREVLNLGHTIGHALESLSQQPGRLRPLRHGSAVAFGMLCKIKLLELQNSESRDIAARMQRILFRSGCLNEVAQWLDFYGRESEGWESQNLWRAIQPYILQDKKIREQVTVESDSGFGKPVRIVGFSREGFGVASPLVPRVVPIDISIEGPLALAFESAVQQILGSAVLKRPSE